METNPIKCFLLKFIPNQAEIKLWPQLSKSSSGCCRLIVTHYRGHTFFTTNPFFSRALTLFVNLLNNERHQGVRASMNFFRKYLLSFSVIALLSFFTISSAEDFHHHDNLESQDNCAFCSFILTAAQVPSTPVPPLLFPIFLVFSLFVFQVFFTSFRSVSPRGRSPPALL